MASRDTGGQTQVELAHPTLDSPETQQGPKSGIRPAIAGHCGTIRPGRPSCDYLNT